MEPHGYADAQKGKSINESYHNWYSSHQNWFTTGSPPSAMAGNSNRLVRLLADGQDGELGPLRARQDSVLSQSLISREVAEAVGSHMQPIKDCPKTQDGSGTYHQPQASTSLRFYYEGTAQTSQEVFYIVESCGDCDVILRKDVKSPPDRPQAHPLFTTPLTLAEQEQRKVRELEAKKRSETKKQEQTQRIFDKYKQVQQQGGRKKG